MTSPRHCRNGHRGVAGGRRRWLAGLIATLAIGAAPAQQAAVPAARAVGIFAFLGNGVEVMLRGKPDASRVDRGGREVLRLRNTGFDQTVLLSARQVLKTAAPTAHPYGYAATPPLTDAELVALESGLLAGQKLPEWVEEAISQDRLTELVIVVRTEADLALKTERGEPVGEGRVTGLGFYIDRHSVVRSTEGQLVQGWLGAYVYLKLWRVDVATRRILSTQSVATGLPVVLPHAKSETDPWLVLGPAEKLALLNRLLAEGMQQTLPALLADR